MEAILTVDRLLFTLMNHLPHTRISDWIALAFSGIGFSVVVWGVIGLLLFIREERKDQSFIAFFLTTGFGAYLLVEAALKPFFGRFRPGSALDAMIVESVRQDSYSFPSSHATVAFALAIYLGRKEPRWKWALYLLALFVSVSRIYLGKHYPIDVVAGALIGVLIGRIGTFHWNSKE